MRLSIDDLGTGYSRIINRNSGKDMVVQSASTALGANIFQYTYGGSATNDEWQVASLGNGYYRITNHNSGKSAEVASGSTSDSANIDQRTYGGSTWAASSTPSRLSTSSVTERTVFSGSAGEAPIPGRS